MSIIWSREQILYRMMDLMLLANNQSPSFLDERMAKLFSDISEGDLLENEKQLLRPFWNKVSGFTLSEVKIIGEVFLKTIAEQTIKPFFPWMMFPLEKAELCQYAASLLWGIGYQHARVHLLASLKLIPRKEREMVSKLAAGFMLNKTNGYNRAKLIGQIHKVPIEDRRFICDIAISLIRPPLEDSLASTLVKSFRILPRHDREEFAAFSNFILKSFQNSFFHELVIKQIRKIPRNERVFFMAEISSWLDKELLDKDRLKILKAFITIPPEKRSLFSYLASLLFERHPCAESLSVLAELPSDQWQEVCRNAVPFMRYHAFDREKRDVIIAISTLCRLQRDKICQLAAELLPFIKKNNKILRLIIFISSANSRHIYRACSFVKNILSESLTTSELIEIIKSSIELLDVLDEEQIQQMIVFLKPMSSSYQLTSLRFLQLIYPRQLKEALYLLRCAATLLPSYLNPGNLLVLLCSESEVLKERTHEFLQQTLLTQTCQTRAHQLADILLRHRYHLDLSDDAHPLVELSFFVKEVSFNRIDLKNPYKIYNDCCLSRRDLRSIHVPVYTSPWGEFQIDLKEIFREISTFLPKKNVLDRIRHLDLSSSSLYALIEEIELLQQINESIQEKILELSAMSWQTLKSNLQSPYFRDLLDTPLAEKVDLPQAYFLALMSYVMTSSPDRDIDELSPRQQVLIKLSASIQHCIAGKAEAISLAYQNLDPSHKYTLEIPSDEPLHVTQVKKILFDFFHMQIEFLFSSNSRFMQQAAGLEVTQLYHHSLYIKNKIASLIGLPHTLQFDLHTHLLSTELVTKSEEKLIDLFFSFVNVDFFIAALIQAFSIFEEPTLRRLFNAISEMKTDEISWEDLWKDSEVNPLGVTLTERGAIFVLQKLNLIIQR